MPVADRARARLSAGGSPRRARTGHQATIPYLRRTARHRSPSSKTACVRFASTPWSSRRSHAADNPTRSRCSPGRPRAKSIAPESRASASTPTEGYRLPSAQPTGRFEIGGPMGDRRLTGAKIIVEHVRRVRAARRRALRQGPRPRWTVSRGRTRCDGWPRKSVAAGLAQRLAKVRVAYATGKRPPRSACCRDVGTRERRRRCGSRRRIADRIEMQDRISR